MEKKIDSILPKPKPRVTADFRQKINQIKSFEPDNSSTPQFPLASQSRDKNTAALERTTIDILRFERKFIPELELSKKAKFSIDEMLKHKKSTNPFQSSKPKTATGIANRQCKLVPMQKKKAKINIRNIQTR